MNLSELCIRRPVMTVLLSGSFVVAGLLDPRWKVEIEAEAVIG